MIFHPCGAGEPSAGNAGRPPPILFRLQLRVLPGSGHRRQREAPDTSKNDLINLSDRRSARQNCARIAAVVRGAGISAKIYPWLGSSGESRSNPVTWIVVTNPAHLAGIAWDRTMSEAAH
jgi:hypothetical protein